ncbi:MAG: aldehyde dehydrogenase [Bacteroidales bacterium]
MEPIEKDQLKKTCLAQRRFFATRKTRELQFRKAQLIKLRKTITKYEQGIIDALWQDLRKSPEETYLTEISVVLMEISHHLKNMSRWARTRRRPTPFHLRPSKSRLMIEPLGRALIIAPWNYPFHLMMSPLVGAISAGCCAILKPSPDARATSALMKEIIRETFDPEYISLVEGGREVNTLLLEQRHDLIFFTGSTKVGKVVMEAAAKYLTPVLLELGGKSPCIVDKDAKVDVAARRIAWGKTINAGQTCVAPDYVLVHESLKEELISEIIKHLESMYGKDPRKSPHYPRIINNKAMDRLLGYLQEGNIIYGGKADTSDNYISPTLMDEVGGNDPIMQNEIFGPLLPVISFKDIEDAIKIINDREKPLAFYYFGNNHKAKGVLSRVSSGGVCLNDTILHVANHHLPFGGVGHSGTGRYHGKESFLAFSNRRAVLQTPTWPDLPFQYPPFKMFGWVKNYLDRKGK